MMAKGEPPTDLLGLVRLWLETPVWGWDSTMSRGVAILLFAFVLSIGYLMSRR